MFDACPRCRLRYEREQGYFLGAMYISYLASIPPALLLALLFWKLAGWPFDWAIAGAFVAYLPLVPVVARFARVVWMYMDQYFDPR